MAEIIKKQFGTPQLNRFRGRSDFLRKFTHACNDALLLRTQAVLLSEVFAAALLIEQNYILQGIFKAVKFLARF